MFQSGDVLLTWATIVPTSFDQSLSLTAEKLVDHRLRYLDYEGEIEGDRGKVSRLLKGDCNVQTINASEFTAVLSWTTSTGKNLQAAVCVQRKLRELDLETRDDVWELRFDSGLKETKR